jgi:prevent-host-death family protein
MIRLNVHEAKTHLSKYLNKVAKGETLLLCKRNVPVAEVRAIPVVKRKRRLPFGAAKGEIIIHDSFFDPLPDDLLDLFEGKGEPEGTGKP